MYFSCLDASVAIKPVFDRFQSVVITSGVSHFNFKLEQIELLPSYFLKKFCLTIQSNI